MEYFKFEVRPFVYSGNYGGTEKVLHIQINVNGQDMHIEKVVPPQQDIFETEFEYYMRLAITSMQEELKSKIRN